MNRIIKFRGKRIDNGEWCYGYYVRLEDYFRKPINGKERITHRIYSGSADTCTSENGYDFSASWYDVNPNTVSQFTGLTDKNKKEIYEGDILHIREYDNELFDNFNDDQNRFELFSIDEIRGELRKEYITPVTWIDGVFCLSSEYNNPNYQNDMFFCCLFGDMRRSSPIFEIEIIGNIFDNEELVEGGEK